MVNLHFSKSQFLFSCVKLPYYTFSSIGAAACRIALHDLLPRLFSESISNTLRFQAKKLKIYESHFDSRMNLTFQSLKFRNYLVQPTVNLPKIKVVKKEKDIKEAVKLTHKIKRSLKETLGTATPSEIIRLARRKNLSTKGLTLNEVKNLLLSTLLAGVPEESRLEDTQFDGVCGMLIAQFASEKLRGRNWDEIAYDARKGATAKTAGLQIVYASLDLPNPYELASFIHKVSSERVTTIHSKNSNNENLQKISNLQSGIYRLSFVTTNARHGIILSKENGYDYILDPNIGLLTCPEHKTEQLLKKIVATYPKRKTKNQPKNIVQQFFHNFKKTEEANIELQAFKFIPTTKKEGLKRALFGLK